MQRLITGMLAVITLLALASPSLAGGWATVRLDEEPGVVREDVPWTFGFMVLQHDVSPNSDVTPVLRAQHRETGDIVTATATQEGTVGHFVVEVAFPQAGEWKWSIEPQPFAATSFKTLTVLGAGDEAAPAVADNASSSATSATRLPPGTPVPAADLAEEPIVTMLDSWAFQPARLKVAPGTEVTWINTSTVVHAVTGDDLAFDDSGLLEPGESFSFTFTEPGTYHYRCSPHPGMEGVVVVG